MNAAHFTEAFSQRLRSMWQTWCASPDAATARDAQQQHEALALCEALMQQDPASALQAYQMVLKEWQTIWTPCMGWDWPCCSISTPNKLSPFWKKPEVFSAYGPAPVHAECVWPRLGPSVAVARTPDQSLPLLSGQPTDLSQRCSPAMVVRDRKPSYPSPSGGREACPGVRFFE